MTTANPITDSIRIVQHRADAATWWFHIAVAYAVYYVHLAVWQVRVFLLDTTRTDRVVLATGAGLVLAALIGWML